MRYLSLLWLRRVSLTLQFIVCTISETISKTYDEKLRKATEKLRQRLYLFSFTCHRLYHYSYQVIHNQPQYLMSEPFSVSLFLSLILLSFRLSQSLSFSVFLSLNTAPTPLITCRGSMNFTMIGFGSSALVLHLSQTLFCLQLQL